MKKKGIKRVCVAVCIAEVVSFMPAFSAVAHTTGGQIVGNPTEPPSLVTSVPTYIPTPQPTAVPVEIPSTVTAEPGGGESGQPSSGEGEEGSGGDSAGEPMTGGSGFISVNVTVDTSNLEKLLKEYLDYNPAVTVIYSVNNELDNGYYKPSLKDIPNVRAWVEQQQNFVVAYDEFFDMTIPYVDEDGNLRSVDAEVYKPEGWQCRELEILGYDFLLDDEWYYFEGEQDDETKYSKDTYIPKRVDEDLVKYGTAIMDIYKALGEELYYCSYQMCKDETVTLESSPVALNLPSYVKTVDNSRAKTRLFITRTKSSLYFEKAVKELGVIASAKDWYITGGEFIVLLARMMEMYGEPVLSETETNLLLQIYGADIPPYLSGNQLDAYIYLKARGILNIEVNYNEALTLKDMLNILMCVKDKGSRTTWKEIQVSMDISDALVNKGYFPKPVTIMDGDDAFTIEGFTCDYASAMAYDYYLEVNEYTKFLDGNGRVVSNIIVFDIPGDFDSGQSEAVRFLGRVVGDDGKEYYHITCSIDHEFVKKNGEVTKSIILNTLGKADSPGSILLPEGGGIYTVDKPATYKYLKDNKPASVNEMERGNVTYRSSIHTKRRAFIDGEFEGSVDKERAARGQRESSKSRSGFWASVLKVFGSAEVVYAADSTLSFTVGEIGGGATVGMATNGVCVSFTMLNMDGAICSYTSAAYRNGLENITKNGSVWRVKLLYGNVDVFLSSVRRASGSTAGYSFMAIANITGEVLVPYSVLKDALLVFGDGYNEFPEPEEQGNILYLNTRNGQVKLNNATKEIVAGSTLYNVAVEKADGVLFYAENNPETLQVSELYVDFRAAYGWSNESIQTLITGSSSGYTVSIKKSAEAAGVLRQQKVRPIQEFMTDSDYIFTYFVNKGSLADGGGVGYLFSVSYPLANWMLYETANTGGTEDVYLFVFYHKDSFTEEQVAEYSTAATNRLHTKYKKEQDEDEDELADVIGYAVANPDWYYRMFKLQAGGSPVSGRAYFAGGYGYVYDLPESKEARFMEAGSFDTEKFISAYLSGDVMLPIYYDGDSVRNANVNVFMQDSVTLPYGHRPTVSSEVSVYPAPAGVISLYGGGQGKKTVFSQSGADIRSELGKWVYYGTTLSEFMVGSGSVTVSMQFAGNNAAVFSNRYSGLEAYRVFVQQKYYTSGLDLESYWVVMTSSSSVLETVSSDVEKEIVVIESEAVTSEEVPDSYDKYNSLKLSNLIHTIDFGATYAVVFVFEIFPLVGLILMTVLVGLCLASDSKIMQVFCIKVFDPIKLLTFGKKDATSFRMRDSVVSLLIGYTVFGLIYDGNLLRLIEWALGQFGRLAAYIN